MKEFLKEKNWELINLPKNKYAPIELKCEKGHFFMVYQNELQNNFCGMCVALNKNCHYSSLLELFFEGRI